MVQVSGEAGRVGKDGVSCSHPSPCLLPLLASCIGAECFGVYLLFALLRLACPMSHPYYPVFFSCLHQGAECFGVFLQWGLDKVVLKDIWDRVAGDAGHLTAPQVRSTGHFVL